MAVSSITVEILEGNARKITATFRVPGDDADLDDFSTWDLTDPSTITFTRIALAAAQSTLETWTYAGSEVTRESIGVYSKVLGFETPATWVIGAEGTGACEAYGEIEIPVRRGRARA